MIRHVVMWKLSATDAPAKAAAIAAIAGALDPLVGVVPGLQSLMVRPNVAYLETNYDAILVSDFDTVEALEQYQVHPAHGALRDFQWDPTLAGRRSGGMSAELQ